MPSLTEKILARTITQAQISAEIGIDKATFWRWVKRGIFPPPSIKVGRTVRWSTAAVEEWLAKGVQA